MKAALALILALIATPVLATTPIQQSGQVTPRHAGAWTTNGVMQDAGPATNGFLSELGITKNGGCALGINSGPTTGPYTQFCFGVTAGQGYFNLQSFGGAPAATLGITINGTTYPFPGPGNGDVLGPPSSIDGDVAVFNGAGGTLLKDGGPPSFNVTTNAALVALPLTGKAAGYTVSRSGYYATGDSPLSTYTLQLSGCSLNGGLGDGGSQVASAISGNCWILTAQAVYDPRQWGAVNSTAATTGTASGTALTLASAQDFQNGQSIAVIGAGTAFSLSAPGSLVVGPHGGTGSTTYSYTIAPIDQNLGVGRALTTVTITNGMAQLGIPIDGTFGPAVWNEIAWSGSAGAVSYAIYGSKGASPLACIAVTAKLQWSDYGTNPAATPPINHQQTCPSWVPATPPASAQADVLRATILSGGGTTSLVLATASSTSVSGAAVSHDSGTQIANALNLGLPFGFGCGDYNVFVALTMPGGSLAGNGCTTLHSYVNVNTLTVTGDQAWVTGMTFAEANTAAGFGARDQGNRTHWLDIEMTAPYNMIEIEGSFSPDFTNFRGSGIGPGSPLRGDYGVYMHGIRAVAPTPSTFTQNPYFYNLTVPQTTSACSFVIDGDVNGVTTYGSQLLAGPCEYQVQNTVGGLFGPQLSKNYAFAVNNAWGPPMVFTTSADDYMFSRLFLQGHNGNDSSCIFIGAGVGPITIVDQTEIFACDKHGIDEEGNELQTDNTTLIYANSAESAATYDKVHIGASATGGMTIGLAAGDHFASVGNAAPDERCGVFIDVGFNSGVQTGYPLVDTTTNGPGLLAPVCDQTGLFGQVKVDGVLSPNTSTSANATGVTIAAANMVQLPGQISWFYRSGQASAVTDTTATAASILALIPNAVAGSSFDFRFVNLGGFILTLAGGTGVTISGMANSKIREPHDYICTVTNPSPAAINCFGQPQ